jgi:hypothetical protein
MNEECLKLMQGLIRNNISIYNKDGSIKTNEELKFEIIRRDNIKIMK